MKVEDVVIIGAGPAGVAAAIQLKRYGLDPVLLEKEAVGGLLRNAHWVENYPGFPEGISGMDLVRLFERQLERWNVPVHFEEVLEVANGEGLFRMKTSLQLMVAEFVVVATGTVPVCIPDLLIPDDAQDRIFYEVYPIRDVAGQKIAIIGAGDAAFDYALHLSGKNEVIILNRGHRVTCLPLLWDRSRTDKNISIREGVSIQSVAKADDKLSLTVQSEDKPSNVVVDYLLIAVGREPRLDCISGDVQASLDRLMREGKIYLIGDLQNGRYRQTAISVGDGVKTAMSIYHTMRSGVDENCR